MSSGGKKIKKRKKIIKPKEELPKVIEFKPPMISFLRGIKEILDDETDRDSTKEELNRELTERLNKPQDFGKFLTYLATWLKINF